MVLSSKFRYLIQLKRNKYACVMAVSTVAFGQDPVLAAALIGTFSNSVWSSTLFADSNSLKYSGQFQRIAEEGLPWIANATHQQGCQIFLAATFQNVPNN
jgi:hypothetical protein